MAKRTESVKKAQKAYDQNKLDAGAHVQINVKFKARADVEMMDRLKARFPDLTASGIARVAIKALDGKSNAPARRTPSTTKGE